MGLSSKQVSGDGFDWAKNLMQAGALELPNVTAAGQQQAAAAPPPLKCPRCESTNTKFCYYNNYNRLQPRHFCKSCKRHWTKGGTLRNVPVGGGRKNKRLKTSSSSTANKNVAMCHGSKSGKTAVQPQHQLRPMEFSDQKKFSEILYQSFLQPTSSLLPDYINSGLLNPTTLPLDSVTPSFGYPPPSFDANVQFPNVLDEIETDTEAITTTMPAQWQTPMDGPMDMSTETSYWSWEDLHTMISTDEKQPWDDS